MDNITFEIITKDEIELCRNLCNELMAFQKSKAVIAPEAFDLMNFDTRMRRSFESTPDAQVIVAKDNGVPVGYVFSDIEDVQKGDKSSLPDWAPESLRENLKNKDGFMGFYPDWDKLPERCGCLNNIYLREGYRHQGLGKKLFNMTMDWMKSFPGIDLIFVYISNGNDEAFDFYLKNGFVYSHEVFGGFIKAMYCRG